MTLQIDKQHRSFDGTQMFCHHDSAVLGCRMGFAVYTPPGSEGKRLPVLWLLSGLTGPEENFVSKSGMQQYWARHNMVVIPQDTSRRGTATPGEEDDYALGTGAGFYVNATADPWAKHYQMDSYITDELQKLIVESFPVDSGRQAICGFSMGGHGALVLSLRNPSLYQSVSALAPISAPSQCPWGINAFKAYFGEDSVAGKGYDAVALIAQGARRDTIMVDQGGDDEFLVEQLRPELLQAACAEAGQPLEYRLLPGYDHSFYFVASVIGEHLAFHARRLG